MKLISICHEVAESPLELLEYVMKQGWGDGLPVIPTFGTTHSVTRKIEFSFTD